MPIENDDDTQDQDLEDPADQLDEEPADDGDEDQGDDGDEGGAAARGEGEGDDGDGKLDRKRRRELFDKARKYDTESKTWQQQRDQWEHDRRALQDRLDALERRTNAPPPRDDNRETPEQKQLRELEDEIDAAATAMAKDETGASYKRWKKLQDKKVELLVEMRSSAAAERVVREHMKQLPRPRQLTPEAKQFYRDFPFASEDEAGGAAYQAMINGKAEVIAAKRKVDLRRAPPKLAWAIMREAAAAVARAEGINLPGKGQQRPTARRVSGTPGRTGGGPADDGEVSVDDLNQDDAQRAADALYPQITDPKKRLAKWMKEDAPYAGKKRVFA